MTGFSSTIEEYRAVEREHRTMAEAFMRPAPRLTERPHVVVRETRPSPTPPPVVRSGPSRPTIAERLRAKRAAELAS